MSPVNPKRAASVRARLRNVAKTQGVDFQQVLVRFALERILYPWTPICWSKRSVNGYLCSITDAERSGQSARLPGACRRR